MALADTILAVVSAVAALVTVWLAYLALSQARQTVDEAKAARLDAELAAKDAAAERRTAAEDRRQAAEDRREEERDRQRRRIEHVGEIIEAMASAAQLPDGGRWETHRNRLRQGLVGLHDRLPQCERLVRKAVYHKDVSNYVGTARSEVEVALKHLDGEPG